MKTQLLALAAAMSFMGFLSGCATPGAPMPPSLHLPERAGDLAAARNGDRVTLTWTMPRRNTDKMLLKEPVAVHICRRLGAGPCETAQEAFALAPGANGQFHETLPATLTAGAPRPLSYFVEFPNRAGRSAGLSNAAVVLAGTAPEPVAGLKAELRKQGVALFWKAGAGPETIRLQRKLIHAAPKDKEGPLGAPPEAAEQKLLVEPNAHPGAALDKEIRFGQVYEYRAQRIVRVEVEGKLYELAGELSPPVRVDVEDVFAPATPTELAAVASNSEDEPPTIDLNWRPVEDANLAGYFVYRSEDGAEWRRISPAEPLIGPAFRDAQVAPGRSYRYAVSAVGRNGRQSQRSAPAEESVPER